MAQKAKLLTAITVIIASVLGWQTLATAAETGKMTIKRIDDPITVQGADLKPFLGKPISKLRLVIWEDGKFAPVPYQIDERHPSGGWVFPEGEEPEKDEDGGLVDENDELAFMAKDAGDEAPAGNKPEGAGAGVKISLKDPVDGGAGYAYVFLFEDPPARSEVDYATYKVGDKWMWMIGQTYKIGTGVGESYFDKCHLKMPDGSWSPDVIDRYKTRGMGIPVVGRTPESQAKAEALGWKDGPVRVLRKSAGWLELALKIKIHGEGSSQNLYYPSYFLVPLKLQIPGLPKFVIRDFSMVQTLDFTHHFYGAKYYDAVNTRGVVLDGKMSEAEKNLDLESTRTWYCATGPVGTVFVRYVYPGIMETNIYTEGYYVDDATKKDPPEEEPGQSNAGIWMKNLAELGKGTYKYNGYFLFPKDFSWSNRDRILNMADHPIEVTTKKVE